MGIRRRYFNQFLMLTVILFIKLSLSVKIDPNEKATSVFEFWKRQEKNLILGTQKEIILVLGTAGAGKSAVTVLMTEIDNMMVKRNSNLWKTFDVIDKENHIHVGGVSKTLVPAVMIDKAANISYYDCPGFADNRSLDHHVTIAYFLKKITTFASSLKFIFTVKYYAFFDSSGYHFNNLLIQAVRLIKDIEKFKHGIAMIVTKVHNSHYVTGENNTDSMAHETIVNFLEEYRVNLEDSSKEQDIESIKFIDLLLEKYDNTYPRIGLFRDPLIPDDIRNDPTKGNQWPLKNISNYKTVEADLKKIVYENIEYVSTADHNFGYSMTDGKQDEIQMILEALFRNHIPIFVSKMCDKIDKFHHGPLKKVDDLILMHHKLKKVSEILSKVKMDEFLPRILMQLVDVVNDLGVFVCSEDKKQITALIERVDFLMKVYYGTIYNQKFIQIIHDTTNRNKDTAIWYDFIIKLFNTLSQIDSQIDEVKNAASDLHDKIPSNTIQPVKVKNIDFNRLMMLISIEDYSKVVDLEINQFELEALRFVLTAPFGLILKSNKFGYVLN